MKSKTIFINLIIFIFLAILIEMISSLILFHLKKDSYNINYKISYKTIGDYSPNQNGIDASNKNFPFRVIINDEGFRASQKYCEKCKKIFFMGDSQTFGLYVDNLDIFSEKTILKLKGNYRSFNNGITGSTLNSSIEFFNDKIIKNNITNSIFVYTFFTSDIIELDILSKRKQMGIRYDAIKNDLKFKKQKEFLLKISSFFNLLKYLKNYNQNLDININDEKEQKIINEKGQKTINEKGQKTTNEKGQKSINEKRQKIVLKEVDISKKDSEEIFVSFLNKLILFENTVEKNNNLLIFQYVPDYFDLPIDNKIKMISARLEKNLNHFISYYKEFNKFNIDKLYFHYDNIKDPHIKPLGHEIIAEKLSQYIKSENL